MIKSGPVYTVPFSYRFRIVFDPLRKRIEKAYSIKQYENGMNKAPCKKGFVARKWVKKRAHNLVYSNFKNPRKPGVNTESYPEEHRSGLDLQDAASP